MTHSDATDLEAKWAIEVEREDRESEFFSIVGMQVGPDDLRFLTPDGTRVSLKTAGVRKILLMRVKEHAHT
jgi:hypothetical protein